MSTNDGGPAFPTQYSNEADGPTVMPSVGMSLRDYFAAMAMQALRTCDNVCTEEQIAKWAYRQADAMLAARDAK